MKPRSLCLTLALGLFAGLVACQDGGVVAPDDNQVSPEDLVVAAKKGGNSGGGKPSKGGTATLTLADGMVASAEGLTMSDDDKSLSVNGHSGIQIFLENTFAAFKLGVGEPGEHGACKTSPADADLGMVEALANELFMYPAPTDVEGFIVAVNKEEALGSIRMTYRSDALRPGEDADGEDPEKVGLISFGVRESLLFPEFETPEVAGTVGVNGTPFTISGGAAIVWWREVKHKHRITLVCPNLDVVTVTVKKE